MSEAQLGTSDIARLLGISRPRVWQLRKDPTFPQPIGRDKNDHEYWYETQILRWAATARKDLAAKAPRLWRATSGRRAPYLGTTIIDGYMVVLWDSEVGRIGQAYAPAGLPIDRTGEILARLLPRVHADVLVGQDAAQYDQWGPELRAVDADVPDRVYRPRWADLANVIGTAAPYWPHGLVQPEAMERWMPDSPPPAVAPRHPELNTAPLLRMHSTSPDDSHTGRAALHLARAIDAQAAEAARGDIRMLANRIDRSSIALAATILEPAAVDDPREEVLRNGWSEIIVRSDPLAHECVLLAAQWDGGRYFPFSTTTTLRREHSDQARAWYDTLKPAESTAAITRLTRGTPQACFTDPATDLPAIISERGDLVAAVPQRLPASKPLGEVIFSDGQVWIRTTDGTLYLAPEQSGCGLMWGYRGSGATTLAYLLNRLLADINSLSPRHVPGQDEQVPPGLFELIANTPRTEGATYTRAELLSAQAA
ncbi:hypothetical protein GCM10010411_74750 [Actinomadura fulvescens]|uniref:Uncharacterized protein n=1 Tax=Actinomadura fulvescens TaxID=46160 RepID=A0ABN3QHN8_9ACTN